jgi:translation elongation factor EF-1alpha
MAETEIGKVTHFFDRIGVAAITLSGDLAVGDTIHIKGHTSDFTTVVEAMQIEHAAVQAAKAGDQVGMKVPQKAHEHDKVFKVTP